MSNETVKLDDSELDLEIPSMHPLLAYFLITAFAFLYLGLWVFLLNL
ncbi:MAG: hypothetical protein PWQ96_2430 [Clostridia bacterium]|nr:hypothetical protein [Clostridia bacterium]